MFGTDIYKKIKKKKNHVENALFAITLATAILPTVFLCKRTETNWKATLKVENFGN